MKFKVGDKVKVLRKDTTFGWTCEMIDYVGNVFEIDAVKMASTGVDMLQGYKIGMYCWSEDALELAQPKFNPKPGDKIICNNGEEFVCCTLETLNNFGITPTRVFKEGTIFGKGNNELASWMYWSGVEYPREFNWEIKEIIPASQQEVKQEVTEVIPAQGDNTVDAVFQEKTYTLALIRNLFLEVVGRYDDGEEWNIGAVFKEVQEQLEGDYQQYLELKAKFEGKT